MTDNTGGTPPFSIPGFPGFGQADMMGKMWEMMRLNPFAAAMPGGAQGVGPSLSMMSDMLAPLTNIEELDKRVTDMRAVEQWLKLNLNMLQSAIQALEVQRATLATLRSFGAFAQTSMEGAKNAAADTQKAAGRWPMGGAATPDGPKQETGPQPSATDDAAQSANLPPGFDPSGWWNVLQSQFNQLAHLAMIQPGMTGAPGQQDASAETAAQTPAPGDPAGGAESKPDAAAARKAAVKKSPPRKKGE
ncbi:MULTISPECIES: PhaM family polyhydroxyalkanoate granule multifunctional regulatory protein [unclassified Caballeronia]|uniref:PhaM family polyhydroxyalkanoate granule multifunctional regulatory protein n=1 Tax=unclassified Caballeronia TaxID=2646786 RepID=UPI002866E6E4|nr:MULTISPECIES: PhaM family polyhydroxyalkanoate granule multifunctional regulatory protein [unclassified Caballeronia]MDR5736876.1 alginate biosynthesis protein AlgP [Caballeronia sp. LZ016]MDR5810592.1 alginate biosynthesis protein AlgP [Caballeronia sp. LZ019]